MMEKVISDSESEDELTMDYKREEKTEMLVEIEKQEKQEAKREATMEKERLRMEAAVKDDLEFNTTKVFTREQLIALL